MWLELFIVAGLILLNGFFACAELAIVNTRRSRIKQLAEPIAVGGVILAISYLSLILGELVPKVLALRNPEPLALYVARPLEWFSKVAAWGIRPLTLSSRLVLRLLGKAGQAEKVFISAEEINLLIREGQEKGVFDKTEQELIRSVFEFTDTSVKEVMIPRPKMCAIEIDTPIPDLLRYCDENKFSRYPVYRKELNDLRGILYQKDLLSRVASGKAFSLTELLHPVYYVPESMKVSLLLKEMQRRRIHMAVVVNEYGSLEGLVTLEDLIEEIVGEIQDEYDIEEKAVERLKDGAYIIDASMSVRDLAEQYGLPIPAAPDYETLSGFIIHQIQGLPRGGEVIYHGGYKFTVVDLGERRVAKVKVERVEDRSRAVKESVKPGPK